MEIYGIFELRKGNPYLNTSYPIDPKIWSKYRVYEPLSFSQEREMSFYIHIPFCKQICSFCEYSRVICPDDKSQYLYLTVLQNDIRHFMEDNSEFKLNGFDIGGGTPTSLSRENFNYLMTIYDDTICNLQLTADYEPSIEATFNTIDDYKLDRIVSSGITRLSLGVQSSDNSILMNHHREHNDVSQMDKVLDQAYQVGVTKINLDMMYGLPWQDKNTINNDLELLNVLSPEQVTLYELRPNMVNIVTKYNKDCLYEQYMQYFEGLIKLGYVGRIGQNTFSKNNLDYGVSSYLRSRMFNATAYKGFGLSAQSMSKNGISYNYGKKVSTALECLSMDSFPEEYTYLLPPEELCAKYIAIAAYSGRLSIEVMSTLLGCNAAEYYAEILDFCFKNAYIEYNGDNLYITSKGFRYYGAVFSLFYPNNQVSITHKERGW